MGKHLQKITWIAFDYGGTLANVSPPIDVDVMYVVLRRDFNINVQSDFKKLFRLAIEKGEHEARTTYIECPLVFYLEAVLAKLNLMIEFPLEEIINRFYDIIGDGAPYQDVKPVLNTLHKKGYSLLLAANTLRTATCREKTLQLAGLRGFFKYLILSSEIGYRKPHREFYRIVTRTAGVPPERIVFVGDALEKDVIAPAKAGMHTIWVNRDSVLLTVDIQNHIGQVKTVSEILKLLV